MIDAIGQAIGELLWLVVQLAMMVWLMKTIANALLNRGDK